MKRKLLATMLATWLIIPFSSAQSAVTSKLRISYKCHLALLDQSEVVHGFVSVGKTTREFTEGLKGRLVYFADGVNGSKIEHVYECVTADKNFKTTEARLLEAKTPF